MAYQKLITAAIAKQMEKFPRYSTDGNNVSQVLVKFFCCNHTWYVLEAEKLPNGDYEFFGLVEGQCKELGYFLLSELQSVRGQFGLPVERDMHFDGYVVDKERHEVRKVKCAVYAH